MAEAAQVAFEPVKRVTVEATCETAINVIIVNVMRAIEEGGHRGSRLNNCWAQTKRNTRAYAQQRAPALQIQKMGGRVKVEMRLAPTQRSSRTSKQA